MYEDVYFLKCIKEFLNIYILGKISIIKIF